MFQRLILGLLLLSLVTPAFLASPAHGQADDTELARKGKANPSKNAEKSKNSLTRSEREQVALGFVKEHHPELAGLLEQLKSMRPVEYNRAISELFQVSKSLDALKKNNPAQYEIGLESWKAKSEAELLGAKLINSPSPELESQLRVALERQFDLEIRKQEQLQEQLKARLSQVEKSVKRLKTDRDRRIEARLQELQKKVRRARRQDGGKSAPAKPARAKKESKA